MKLLSIHRGGTYFRLAQADWRDPLSGAYSQTDGGRWNAPGSFPVVYLNRDERVVRANVIRKFRDQAIRLEDLIPEAAPSLAVIIVPEGEYADIVTDEGCVAAGLPATYPRDAGGAIVGWESCRPVGQSAWEDGHPGIACRSAAPTAPLDGEELAFFDTGEALQLVEVRSFAQWF